jgi:hypothetical protein
MQNVSADSRLPRFPDEPVVPFSGGRDRWAFGRSNTLRTLLVRDGAVDIRSGCGEFDYFATALILREGMT